MLAQGYEIAMCLAETLDIAAIINYLRQAELRGGRRYRSHRRWGHRTCGSWSILRQRQLEGHLPMQVAAKLRGCRKEVSHVRTGFT